MIKSKISREDQERKIASLRKKWGTVYNPSRGGHYPTDPSKDIPSLNNRKRKRNR